MSAEFSTYGANAILDGTAIPATLYMKVHVGNPGAAGTNNAAAETSRKAFTRAAAAAGATSNVALIEWNGVVSGETWTHWSAWTTVGPAGGNCWMVGTFVTPVVVSPGSIVDIAVGDLDLSIPIWA